MHALRFEPRALLAATALVAMPLTSSCTNGPGGGDAAPDGAATALDATAFAQDPAAASRILGLSFDEVARRLGSLSFEARTFFVFNRGGEEREQTHVARLTQDAKGDFHVALDAGPSQVEVYLVGEHLFIRQDKGRLRKKPRRDAGGEPWRELAWSSIQQSLALFTPRLRFSDPRPETVGNRQATRYRVTLAPAGEAGVALPAAIPRLPSAPAARWRELARPLGVTGSLWLDGATGVVLKVKLEGRLEVADRAVRPTQITLRFDASIHKPGAAVVLAPAGSVPEFERTPPAGDPIGFFRAELERAGAASPPGAKP